MIIFYFYCLDSIILRFKTILTGRIILIIIRYHRNLLLKSIILNQILLKLNHFSPRKLWAHSTALIILLLPFAHPFCHLHKLLSILVHSFLVPPIFFIHLIHHFILSWRPHQFLIGMIVAFFPSSFGDSDGVENTGCFCLPFLVDVYLRFILLLNQIIGFSSSLLQIPLFLQSYIFVKILFPLIYIICLFQKRNIRIALLL